MEQTIQEFVIILPKGMENVPVHIIKDDKVEEVNISIVSLTERRTLLSATEKCHALIWHQNEYEHVSLEEIMWIEASGSYCHIHVTKDRKFTLAYPLARIEERLPKNQFIRIQRSYLVNIDHVKKLIGLSLIVGNHVLKIGAGYRDRVLDKFIFLGVRNNRP